MSDGSYINTNNSDMPSLDQLYADLSRLQRRRSKNLLAKEQSEDFLNRNEKKVEEARKNGTPEDQIRRMEASIGRIKNNLEAAKIYIASDTKRIDALSTAIGERSTASFFSHSSSDTVRHVDSTSTFVSFTKQ